MNIRPVSLHIGKDRYLALPAGSLPAGASPIGAAAASAIIRRFVDAPREASQLVALAQAIAGHRPGQSHVLRAAGILVAFERRAWVLVPVGMPTIAAPIAAAAVESVAKQLLGARTVKTWVEMEVVDEDGRPMAGIDYTCMMPDGVMRSGKLDKDGKVRFDGIDPGNCAFMLPSLAPDAWRRA